jgi:hypothetical protein
MEVTQVQEQEEENYISQRRVIIAGKVKRCEWIGKEELLRRSVVCG